MIAAADVLGWLGIVPSSFKDRDRVVRVSRDLFADIVARREQAESAYADDPMMNFDEKDLLSYAEDAGLGEIHIQLLVNVEPEFGSSIGKRLLNTSPNPNAHTAGEALRGRAHT